MPKLRFPEFEGEWEIKSMKDIFTEIIEKNHPELPVLSILQGSGTVLRDFSDRKISYDKANLSSYKTMERGDFIIHLRSFEGGLECSNHHGISSPAYKILRTKCLISEAYMDYFRSYMFVHGKLSIAVTGIRDGKSIDMPSFWGIRISFPTINEQRKIAAFLMLLKKRIEKQQQLVEFLKSYKRGALSRLFPKNDASVPEYRFSGFTGDWEQRKVSDITTSYSGGTPQAGNSEYYNGDIPFIRSGEIYQDYTELFITKKAVDNSSAKMISKGDILYALYGATSGEVSRARLEGAINQAILAIVPNKGYNADFLVEWFRKEKANIIDKYLQGGQGNL